MFKGLFYGNFGSSGSGEDIIKSDTPPSDTSKIWLNVSENCLYWFNSTQNKWEKIQCSSDSSSSDSSSSDSSSSDSSSSDSSSSDSSSSDSSSSDSANASKLDFFGDGSCIALYQFDGNANDTGGVYNGTWNGTEQYDTGKFGQAAKFDGNNSIFIDKSVSAFKYKTISLWYKELDSTSSRISSIFQETITTSSPYNGLQLWSGYNNKNLVIRTKKGNETTVCPLSDLTDDFHHIIVTYDMNECKTYVDGILKATIEDTTDLSNLVEHFAIGCNYASATSQRLQNGLIDQVRIFNRALTDDEIQELYKNE